MIGKINMDLPAYPLPFDRIVYVSQHLDGGAYTRVQGKIDQMMVNRYEIEKWPAGWRDYADVIAFLDKFYIVHDTEKEYARRFADLKQESYNQKAGKWVTTSLSNFLNTFLTLGELCAHGPRFLVLSLQQKIGRSLRQALAVQVQRPSDGDLDAWLVLLRQLDNNASDTKFWDSYHSKPRTGQQATTDTQVEGDPMQLDGIGTGRKGPLTADERQRRIQNGLCFYCGGKHLRANCKLAAEKDKAGGKGSREESLKE
jgi:hypothetical protein